MRLLRPGFYWPLFRFWTFSPLGWLAGLLWNICEAMGWAVPFAPYVFGAVMGKTPRKAPCRRDQ